MMKIGVLFLSTLVLFNYDAQAKSLVEGMIQKREVQPDEGASQEPLFENSRYPVGYGDKNSYSKMGPLYDIPNFRAEMIKRSLREHNPSQRQTGIIYGGGKPIGILQPYQESFKFMPIKEERVYSLDGGRSNIDEQEPYINLMYPLARFTRSEDAVRMAELEAAKAEFLDKHYPSMLVDFKIHNKLHPTGYGAQPVLTYNMKREENNPTNNEMRKKKRESQSSSSSSQTRDNQYIEKRDIDTKKQSENIVTPSKQETEVNKITSSNEKREAVSEYSTAEKNKLKVKRQSKLTDSEFQTLKNSVSKRNSKENIQVIEEDLKGLLSDMGLIEDDLEDNAEEMEESRSSVAQDENSKGGFDATIQKNEEQSQVTQNRECTISPERRKRADDNSVFTQTSIPMVETRNTDSKKRTLNDNTNERLSPDSHDNERRFIEVSFTNKDNKDSIAGGVLDRENCPKPSVIPNKREAPKEGSLEQEKSDQIVKNSESKRSEEPTEVTTENYEQYEQRVAREIKNKIKQLKEEVKRELGALEADKDEEDDDESFGETQRKKRFIVNTLMDEETHNIDPNENLDISELEPHVRRRRTLSTDISFGPRRSSLNTFENNNNPEMNMANFDPMPIAQNKADFDVDGYYGELDSQSQSFNNPGAYGKDDITKKDILHSKIRTRKENNYNPYMNENAGRSYRWDNPSMFMKTPRNMYVPEYQRRMPSEYVGPNSVRNSRNDLSSEGNSYNSDYDNDVSNSNSDEEAEGNMNSMVDMTRKSAERRTNSQQFSPNEEHSPKKLQGYNQKYFYYYVGGDENERKQNMAPSVTNSRAAPGLNYQQLSGQYPNRIYNSMNQGQNKQYIQTGNENGFIDKRAFQRRANNMFSRRRKRYVNLMIPSKNKEDAIVTNVFHRNVSLPCYPKLIFDSPSGNPKFILEKEAVREEMVKKSPSHTSLNGNETRSVPWSPFKKKKSSPVTEKEYLFERP
ncbi:GATA zinc finger domain-containing protein 14-like isoform X2 [Harmonia axyridis]|uniref:GATA zinc finger domain-containing protein 14-like isoform X2 n=1 Tax=Harmonia axyridis TaxID=115357 RepID=UPI001E275D72|nr:GATA zinc finger domain-containing protein 14-like isoform X2 [Harmonia axyridis]